ADRYRQEKRHHDDRLCPGSRAPRRIAAGRGHIPGMHAALPADYDDHDGGIARWAASCTGYRYGRGIASTSGNHDRRGPDVQQASDFVAATGCLSLHGRSEVVVWAAAPSGSSHSCGVSRHNRNRMSGLLHLTEADVASLVSVSEAIDILETAFLHQSK